MSADVRAGVALTVGGIRLQITDEQAEDLRRQLGEGGSVSRSRVADETLTPDEATPLMRHSAKSVRALCDLGRHDPRYLKHLRKESKILIRRADVEEWIARQVGGAE